MPTAIRNISGLPAILAVALDGEEDARAQAEQDRGQGEDTREGGKEEESDTKTASPSNTEKSGHDQLPL